jgi:hypothetical protein
MSHSLSPLEFASYVRAGAVSNPAFEYRVTKAASMALKPPLCAPSHLSKKPLLPFSRSAYILEGCVFCFSACVGFQPLVKQLSKELDARTQISEPNFLIILDRYVHE